MKKFFLSLALFATTLVAGAQTEPTLQAKSIYDVDQDGKVGVQDVPALVKGLLGESEDKTAVDTQSLLEVLNKIWSVLADQKAQIATLQQKLGLEPGTTELAHEYVDLGLPSKTLWATCNVGAKKPEDAGLYFAWGETTGYTAGTTDGKNGTTTDGRSFDWASYKWMQSGKSSWAYCTKYTCEDNQTSASWYSNGTYVGSVVDGKTYKNLKKLEPADDAATVNWGSEWCMPTKEQQDELRNTSYCTWKWDDTKKGYTVTSVSNGNSIFLPAAGYRYDGYLYNAGSYGSYWSRTLGSGYSYGAYYLYFDSGGIDWYGSYRYGGRSVRPVRVSQN